MAKLTVQVQYCGGWGYGRYFNELKAFLEQQPFASDVSVVGLRDHGITGNFEVTIKETGQTIHSKKKTGSLAKESSVRNGIAIQIEDALEDL